MPQKTFTPDDVFNAAFEILMELEGLLSDDEHDAGGLTKYGISQKAYPNLDIRSLTVEKARAIYRKDYYAPCGAEGLPPLLAAVVFDTAVNMGVGRAVRFLQEAIGVAPDGAFGPKSQQTLSAACKRFGVASVVNDYLSYRALYYAEIVLSKASQKKFLRGWLRRTYRLQEFLYSRGLA